MTQIIYFVTPKSLVKITSKAGEFSPNYRPDANVHQESSKNDRIG